ncbi:MAG: hypothetical protein RRB13_07645 [bacterium]|nr:hypothetical protein [bacterium]
MESLWKGKAGPPEREVRLEILRFGRDYLACLGGGESHLGAVAWGGGGSLVDYPHKEGPIARALAADLGQFLDAQVLVVAGLHFADLTKPGIQEVLTNARLICQRFKEDWQSAKTGS